MFRYLVLAWNPKNCQQEARARALSLKLKAVDDSWRVAHTGVGLSVLCIGEHPPATQCYLLANSCGVVLGTVFKNAGGGDTKIVDGATFLNADESARILGTSGRHLVDTYWGSYVAITQDPRNGLTRVLRSPAGSLFCLAGEFQGVRLFCSHMPDCAALEALHFSINWRYVARHFTKSIVSEETGLNEIWEVRHGECVELAHDRISKSFYWDARHFAKLEPIEAFADAVSAVHDVTRSCVGAYASTHDSLLLELSGGLDSSVILACLQDLPSHPRVTCLTEYSPGSNSDERTFARMAAERARCELIEHRRNPFVRFEDALHGELTERPRSQLRALDLGRVESEIVADRAITAILSGNRGDELFFGSRSPLAVADCLYRHGPGRRLLEATLNAAELKGYSVWRLWRDAIRDWLFPQPWDTLEKFGRYHPLLNQELVRALQASDRAPPPWYLPDGSILPGKQVHILTLISPDIHFYNSSGKPFDPEHISPLLSQPLIELCLRIPTYVLTSSGWDRAVERQAFANDVPSQILDRRTKGGLEEHAAAVLRHNLNFSRELLLNGALIQNGLLDRRKVEEALSGRPSGVMKGMIRIFQYINMELWLNTWAHSCTRAAA